MSNEPPFPEDPHRAPAGPFGPPPGQQPPGQQPPQPHWQGHQAPLQGGPSLAYRTPTQPKSRKIRLGALAVLLLLVMVGAGLFAFWLKDRPGPSGLAVEDLTSGDCLDGKAFGTRKVSDISQVECDEKHDAEVFATFELEDGEDLQDAGNRCAEVAVSAGKAFDELEAADLEIRPLVARDNPREGDKVACFIRHVDGEKLSSPEFD